MLTNRSSADEWRKAADEYAWAAEQYTIKANERRRLGEIEGRMSAMTADKVADYASRQAAYCRGMANALA